MYINTSTFGIYFVQVKDAGPLILEVRQDLINTEIHLSNH